MTPTPTSGADDMPEALRRSTAADGKTELFNLPGYPLMVRAVDFNRIHTESEMRRAALLDEMQKDALAAGIADAVWPPRARRRNQKAKTMTNPTPHGQVPEALIDLIDAYAETRHRCGRVHNAKTEAARKAVIEALSEVQALSAAPEAIAKLRHLYQNMVNGAVRDTASAKRIAEGLLAPAIEALERATPPAEQQAQPDECFPGEPKVAVPQGLIGAACFAIRNKRDGGKVLEQLRWYSVGDRSQPLTPQQAAPKAAPGGPSDWKPLKTSKEGRDAVRSFFREKLKRHDFDAYIMGTLAADFACVLGGYLEAAPQQEAQEPAARYTIEDVRKARSEGYRNGIESSVPSKITKEMRHAFREKYKAGSIWSDRLDIALEGMLAVAPQPAPAPLSDDAKDAARWRMVVLIGNEVMLHPEKRTQAAAVKAYMDATHSGSDLTGAVDAALAAQGGK